LCNPFHGLCDHVRNARPPTPCRPHSGHPTFALSSASMSSLPAAVPRRGLPGLPPGL
jgi:hypothetical protein